jgi:hypothetical protein
MKNVKVEFYDKQVLRRVNKAANAGLADSADGLENTTKSNAPEKSGKYKNSIGTVHMPEKVELYLVAGGRAAPHAHLIEYGTAPRIQETTGRETGATAPNPVLRKSVSQEKRKITANMIARLRAL